MSPRFVTRKMSKISLDVIGRNNTRNNRKFVIYQCLGGHLWTESDGEMVEAAGIEPASELRSARGSTCLVLLLL